jgi:hypothetical protein
MLFTTETRRHGGTEKRRNQSLLRVSVPPWFTFLVR